MTLAEWKAGGEYHYFNEHQIFVREGGRGDTLLLIHGFPTASWDWHRMWPQLTKKISCHCIGSVGFWFFCQTPQLSV